MSKKHVFKGDEEMGQNEIPERNAATSTQPKDSISDVLFNLSNQLDYASKLGENNNADERKPVLYSLAYVVQALVKLDFQHPELSQLENLLHALGDLDLGIQPSLLSKTVVANAPKQGHKETALYALATVLIELLANKKINAGEKKGVAEESAAKIVSTFMSKKNLPFPGHIGTPGFKALLNWRKNMKYAQKNQIAGRHYNSFSKFVSNQDPDIAESMLRIRMANYKIQASKR